tara:strand:- start:247 stop:432 length:186 start_codon:yes stop_codon:yes gene_type:complete
MTYNEFVQMALTLFPEADIGCDNDDQLVIYTGMMLVNKDSVKLFSEIEEDDFCSPNPHQRD